MLSENIKTLRKAKKLSQEELAIKLNVVRQTVSKWESDLSVPDADMLIKISEALDCSVSTLLGEEITTNETDDLKAISEKLEIINSQLAKDHKLKRNKMYFLFSSICVLIIATTIILFIIKSPYLYWDYSDPETAVIGTIFHAFEYTFVRVAPIIFSLSILGIFITQR